MQILFWPNSTPSQYLTSAFVYRFEHWFVHACIPSSRNWAAPAQSLPNLLLLPLLKYHTTCFWVFWPRPLWFPLSCRKLTYLCVWPRLPGFCSLAPCCHLFLSNSFCPAQVDAGQMNKSSATPNDQLRNEMLASSIFWNSPHIALHYKAVSPEVMVHGIRMHKVRLWQWGWWPIGWGIRKKERLRTPSKFLTVETSWVMTTFSKRRKRAQERVGNGKVMHLVLDIRQ